MTQIQWGAGQCEGRKNLLGERNTDLRSRSAKSRGNCGRVRCQAQDRMYREFQWAFHLEAGAPVRQVEDPTIDRRPAALKGDACPIERAAALARFISALLLRFIHCFDLPATRAQARFPGPSSLGGHPCAKRVGRAACEIAAPEIGGAAGRIEIKVN